MNERRGAWDPDSWGVDVSSSIDEGVESGAELRVQPGASERGEEGEVRIRKALPWSANLKTLHRYEVCVPLLRRNRNVSY